MESVIIRRKKNVKKIRGFFFFFFLHCTYIRKNAYELIVYNNTYIVVDNDIVSCHPVK
jgi:hypothetical protein